MFRKTIISAVCLAAVCTATDALGFALVGPPIGYEVPEYGYGPGDFPQNIGDENRVTVPNFYYACDRSFLDYFGERGREEVVKAMDYFNDLPAFSTMSDDLSEFPLVTYRENFKADALLLSDLKSQIMNMLLADFGLSNPEYYMWSVRSVVLPAGAECPFFQMVLIKRNFDPVTWQPSSYVNGTLYTYQWIFFCNPEGANALPLQIDPTDLGFSAVAGGLSGNRPAGQYFTGFSRDDIGGLRYIYNKNNYNNETLPANTLVGGGGGQPWSIVDPNATNVAAGTTGLRTGVDKFTFEERPYDSLLSQFFEGFTNQFDSTLVTNGTAISQTFGRPVLTPDIILQADNLAVTPGGYTVYATTGPAFSNTGSGSGTIDLGGGIPLTYTINKIGETFYADNPFYLTELEIIPARRWGSFDGTTNVPVLYPNGASIRALEDAVLGSE